MKYNIILNKNDQSLGVNNETITYVDKLDLLNKEINYNNLLITVIQKDQVSYQETNKFNISNGGVFNNNQPNQLDYVSDLAPVVVNYLTNGEGEPWWEGNGWYCNCPRMLKVGDIVVVESASQRATISDNLLNNNTLITYTRLNNNKTIFKYAFQLNAEFGLKTDVNSNVVHTIEKSASVFYITSVEEIRYSDVDYILFKVIPFASGRIGN